MKTFPDISYGTHPMHLLNIYLPETEEFDVFVYFHGGGIEAGSRSFNEFNAEQITGRNVAIVSVEYRMYPDAKFPEYVEDCALAVAWVKNNMEKYGKMKRLFVGGTSAGGYLSMMLCFAEKYLNAVGVSNDDIAGYYHDAGQPTTHFNILKRERGLNPDRTIVDEAAPLYHIDGPGHNYPPMHFVVADNDMKNRYEQTMLVMSTLRNFRYDMSKITLTCMENCTHCSYWKTRKEDGRGLMADEICDFIDSVK